MPKRRHYDKLTFPRILDLALLIRKGLLDYVRDQDYYASHYDYETIEEIRRLAYEIHQATFAVEGDLRHREVKGKGGSGTSTGAPPSLSGD